MNRILILCAVVAGAIQAAEPDRAREYFTDTVLVDQNGAELRMFSDIVQGKTVVMHSFFAGCHGSCPHLLNRMAQLQKMLGDRLGKEVVLVSMTVDPNEDTPERLKEFAQSFKPRPGWYLLTGTQKNSAAVVAKLFPPMNSRDAHDTRFAVFDLRTNHGEKIALNDATAERLLAAINAVSRE